ncbi:sushi domain-containing protein 5 isoform X1 [Thunnus albacares]|uniref:sushi domain-containing protein 5 isoform X1 n=2 Tax=Thunnus albacares TaxID=8236 RepID=UPI001CF6CEA4|nr:sushi domain-containing protein 5 isoform X1 [Thunnus albacares]
MLDRCNQTVLSLLFGCLVGLFVASVVNADGRVFVLDLRNSSGLQGFRDAERACASQHARLASAAELRHAVLECYFSPCTRGWLYGGTVGTTVCNIVGGALKAVDVRTENATEETAHLDAFCIKDKGVACGDPPSFPNARMQGHSDLEMGDELLYTCVPGYVMSSGHSAFSLLCDSCGEWYGLVQVCVKDETESHVDYEDKFTDSYGGAEHHNEGPEEAHGEVYEEVHGAAYPEGKRTQEQEGTSFSFEGEVEHQDQRGEQEVGGEVTEHGRKFEGVIKAGEKDKEQAAEDLIGHPRWEQERKEVVKTDATEAPVSLLSQKHLFWFPSEAFQQEGHPVSTSPVTQTTQRASGAQSDESKEQESQERQPHQLPVDDHDHDHEQDSYADHDTNDRDDHDNSHHDDQDVHDDSHHDDQDDHHSHQDEDGHDDDSKHYISAQDDDLDRRGRYENHDDRYDHYDMGEHEDERDHVRYGSQDYDDREDTYDEHESYEDHEDVTDDHTDDDQEHPDGLEEHPDSRDHDDGKEHYDTSEDDRDHDNLDDHEHIDHDSYDDHDSHDSHEDNDDGHPHVIFSIETDERQNVTQKGAEGAATTDETWLDGYPVAQEETETSDSTTERVGPEDREGGTVVRTTDRPNEVEKPVPYTSLPEMPESPTNDSDLEQGGVVPRLIPTAAPSPDKPEPSNSDTLEYDTQQAAPTHSWMGDLTEHPFLNHGPAPPVHDGDVITGAMEEHTVHNLPSETGDRGEVEGEMGEAICTGEDCPPHPPSSSSRGPTVAAIIVAVCVIAAAVIVGVWCYRRQQQKSSMYKMNGKGQSQTRQGQQIEMQQKV